MTQQRHALLPCLFYLIIKYLYSQCDKQDYLEMTTYKEDKNSIELHPLRMRSLSFTGILPFPAYSYPIGCIAEATGKVVIKKSSNNYFFSTQRRKSLSMFI